MSRRDEVLKHIAELEGLPASTVDAFRLLSDPDFDVRELSQAVQLDPGMTANLLRIANSGYFGAAREIRTVEEAITRLGLRNLFNMLVTSSTAPLFQEEVRGYEIPAGRLWSRSVATAVATDEIGRSCPSQLPELAFTAGLLLDAGKLVLAPFVEDEAEEIADLVDEGLPFDEAEREVLGIDHGEAGSLLLERWHLPEELCDAVFWHHRPEDAGSGGPVLDYTHLADRLALAAGFGEGLDTTNYRFSGKAITRLGYNVKWDRKSVRHILEEMKELEGAFAAPA